MAGVESSAGSAPDRRFTVVSPAPRHAWAEAMAADELSLADQSAEWVDAACASGRFRDASRLYRWHDGRVFVLPLLARRGPSGLGGWLMSMPPAWGIGGIVGAGQDAEVVQAVVDDVRAVGAMRVWLRPDPLRAALWAGVAGPGLVRIERRAHVLELPGGAEVMSLFTKNARKSIRRARNLGVTIRSTHGTEALQEHADMFLDSVDRWAAHQREPRRLARLRAVRRDPPEKLAQIARALGPDRFSQHVALVDGRPVASSITVYARTAHDTRAAMYRDLAGPARANDLLTAHSITEAAARGCRHYHFGETGRSEALAAFKEKFGAVGIDYAEIRIERLPFSRADHVVRSAVKRLIGFRDT